MEKNLFEELSALDVGVHLEKKGRFSYLSWTYAVDILRRKDPTATWEVKRFDGLPFMSTELGYFVEVAVTFQGVTLSQIHPVLDNNNKPIAKPNAFQINTSIQRCLVKAIAITTGLGLYVFSGEDIPNGTEEQVQKAAADVEQERDKTIEAILSLVNELGKKGEKMLVEFEKKANCTLKEMNQNILVRVHTLLTEARFSPTS